MLVIILWYFRLSYIALYTLNNYIKSFYIQFLYSNHIFKLPRLVQALRLQNCEIIRTGMNFLKNLYSLQYFKVWKWYENSSSNIKLAINLQASFCHIWERPLTQYRACPEECRADVRLWLLRPDFNVQFHQSFL